MKHLIQTTQYWYFLFVATQITKIFNIRDWYSILVLLIVVVGLRSMSKIRWYNADFLVLGIMIYSLVSFSFSSYNSELFYYGVKNQFVCMFFYFIARSSDFSNADFIKNFKWAMLIVIIFGIVLYFYPPQWYTSYRYSALLAEEGSRSFYEHTRMSSFFPHPYFLAYGSCFFIILLVKQILYDGKANKFNYAFLLLAFFTLFFSQMRVAIGYTLLFFVSTVLYNIFFRHKKNRFLQMLAISLPLGILLVYLIFSNIDNNFLDYIVNRSTGYEGNIVEDRFEMFSKGYAYISVFGNGLGRFGHAAVYRNLPSVHDCDYVRILCEFGFIGSLLLLITILYIIGQGFKNLDKSFFDVFAAVFFLFAMLGAAPLESTSQHCFLLWFCLGSIIKTQNYDNILTYLKLQQRK